MKKIVKLGIIGLFLFGLVSVANALAPEAAGKLKNWLVDLMIEPAEEEQVAEAEQQVEEVLGEITAKKDQSPGQVQTKVVETIKEVPQKVVSEETVREVTKEVNQVVVEKVERVKQLPQAQVEKTKEELREEIYRGICQQWLKEDEQSE